MSISTQPPLAPDLDWPHQDPSQHPFDDGDTVGRHERTHRQSSEDTVTGLDRWMQFRAANFRSAAGSWTGQAAWLRVNGGSAQEVAAADFHAQRFARQAEVYGRKAS
jgi:hypothetical protein